VSVGAETNCADGAWHWHVTFSWTASPWVRPREGEAPLVTDGFAKNQRSRTVWRRTRPIPDVPSASHAGRSVSRHLASTIPRIFSHHALGSGDPATLRACLPRSTHAVSALAISGSRSRLFSLLEPRSRFFLFDHYSFFPVTPLFRAGCRLKSSAVTTKGKNEAEVMAAWLSKCYF
jgi:hypothetical protein